MKKATKDKGRRLLRPLVRILIKIGVTPTAVTVTALPLSIIAAVLFARGLFLWAGVVVFLIGLCDTLDGEVSRQSGRVSSAGAFIDSTVDRVTEGVVLSGIAWYYLSTGSWVVLVAFGALFFSLLVSYVRARAEGVGRECQVGIFERPVRVGIMVAGALILGKSYFFLALLIIAIGSFVTFIHRIIYVLRQYR